ncbi:hypothetical protein ACHAW5_007407 [Stephanodiscus triporus]|uniref:Uncharacterized protein n=1 Tax=Stephanodiscus triporus TaxID=2934178 RepID=A0ABD3QDI2_9STRA
MDAPDAQATFLGALYSHSIKLLEGGGGGGGGGDESSESGGGGRSPGEGKDAAGNSTTPDDVGVSSFSFLPHMYAPSPYDRTADDKKSRQHRHSDLAAFLRSGPLTSNKRLKNWKHPHSPMVVVITLSARRSVELMKQLSSMRLPVAKLFAKHMSVEDQVREGGMPSSCRPGNAGGGGGGRKGGGKFYSLAVGTPGRLLKLLRHNGRDDGEGGGGGADSGALRLNHTEVVVIDCHEDSKGWNVCTLNDTSRELMEFMKEGIIPQLDKRRGKIKLAMF